MSRVDRILARKLETVVSRRQRTEAGKGPPGFRIVMRQHRRGDAWWRTKFAELVETRDQGVK